MARNVVLVCLDTVRSDYFERFGGELRSRADQSFAECRAASTWSVPSHASMFTGTLPHRHGYTSATPAFDRLDVDETFLSELDGFRRVGVSANPYASPVFGFDGLFDEFHHVTSAMPYDGGLSPAAFWHESDAEGVGRYVEFLRACLAHDRPLLSLGNGAASQLDELFARLPVPKPFDDGCGRILRRARRALAASDEPTFVFVNVMDAHGPLSDVRGYDRSLVGGRRGASANVDALGVTMDAAYDEHAAEIETYRDLYAAAVEYVSRRVASFCESVDDDTAVVVTADHGEQLAETDRRRRFGHVTPDLTEPLLHVPLEVINGEVDADESDLVSHLDLGALVTALATDRPFEPSGTVAAEAAGLGVAHPPTDHERFEFWNRAARCVYRDDRKYVWDSLDSGATYEREEGRYRRRDEDGVEVVPRTVRESFGGSLAEFAGAAGVDAGDLDAAVESRLGELGYL